MGRYGADLTFLRPWFTFRYAATGNVSWNVVAGNGAIQCAGAENAAVKTHAFQGRFEGNLIHGNSELVGPLTPPSAFFFNAPVPS